MLILACYVYFNYMKNYYQGLLSFSDVTNDLNVTIHYHFRHSSLMYVDYEKNMMKSEITIKYSKYNIFFLCIYIYECYLCSHSCIYCLTSLKVSVLVEKTCIYILIYCYITAVSKINMFKECFIGRKKLNKKQLPSNYRF